MSGSFDFISQLPDIITAILCLGFGYYYTRYLQKKVSLTEEQNRRRILILKKHKAAFQFGLGVLYTVGSFFLIIAVFNLMSL